MKCVEQVPFGLIYVTFGNVVIDDPGVCVCPRFASLFDGFVKLFIG
jgi:hypothetical protein